MKEDIVTRGRKRKAAKALQEERLPEALAICEQLARARRTDPEAMTLLATVYRKLNRLAEAADLCRQALRLAPYLPTAHQVLGTVLHCQGDRPGALECYGRALQLDPGLAETHYLAANAYRELEQYTSAIDHYRAELERDPDHVPSLSNLAGTLTNVQKIDQAFPLLQKANLLQPGSTQLLCQMGRILFSRGRYSEAEDHYRQAMAVDSEALDPICMLAELLEKSSRTEEATALVEQGLAMNPQALGLRCSAARLARRDGRHEDAIAIAEAVLAEDPRTHSMKAELHLMLGQLYDQANDAARAFAHFTEGNLLQETVDITRERTRYIQRLDELRDHFRTTLPTLADRHPDETGNAVASPVFLVGFPRSGTTLLEQILDSHPQLQALGEPRTVAVMNGMFKRMVERRPAAAGALTETEIHDLRTAYFREADKLIKRDPERLLVDKQPLNLANAYLIRRVFPGAKFILALRHPCDACLSCFMQHFVPNEAMSAFVRIDTTVQVYANVMSLWQEYADKLALPYHRLRYEDLVEDMETEARRLLEFLGVDWNPAVLDHVAHAKTRAIATPSYHQVTQPIYKKAKYRWKRYAHELAPFIEPLQPFIEGFGYNE